MTHDRRHGGARARSGPRSDWRTPGPKTAIWVPLALKHVGLDLIHHVDDGGPVLYDDSNDGCVVEALRVLAAELEWLAEDRKRQPRRSTMRRAADVLEYYQVRGEARMNPLAVQVVREEGELSPRTAGADSSPPPAENNP